MPASQTFQPLLFDLLAYKWPNTTYTDDFTWKKRKKFSNVERMYNCRTQKEKMALLTQRSRPFNSMNGLNEQEYARRLVSAYNKSASSGSRKNHVNFNNNVSVNDERNSTTANLYQMEAYERKPHVKLNSPPPNVDYYDQQDQQSSDEAAAAAQQLASSLNQQLVIDDNQSNNNNHHWLVYKQDPTPQYILDAKKRLGQIKDPSQAPPTRKSHQKQHLSGGGGGSSSSPSTQQIASSLSSSDNGNNNNERQWMQWPSPATPENIKQIRARLGDDRYRKLSDRLVRCKTAQARTSYEDYVARGSSASGGYRPKTAVLNTQQQQQPQVSVTQEVTVEHHNEHQPSYCIPTAYQVNGIDYSSDQTVVQPDNVIVTSSDSNILPVRYDEPSIMTQQVTTVEDGPGSGQQPIESWVQKASNEDREAIYRILNSLERRNTPPSGGDYSAAMQYRVPSATSWSRRPDNNNNGSRMSNQQQYYRLKSAVATNGRQQASYPTSQSLKKRAGSASTVRKLGTMRSNRNNNNNNGFLINDLLCTQLNGPETVHYGYNV